MSILCFFRLHRWSTPLHWTTRTDYGIETWQRSICVRDGCPKSRRLLVDWWPAEIA